MAFTVLFDALFYGNAQHHRLIRLDTPLGEDWLVPLHVKGKSRLGRDYEFIVDVASSQGDRIELKTLIAQPVTLWVGQGDRSYLQAIATGTNSIKTRGRDAADAVLPGKEDLVNRVLGFLEVK